VISAFNVGTAPICDLFAKPFHLDSQLTKRKHFEYESQNLILDMLVFRTLKIHYLFKCCLKYCMQNGILNLFLISKKTQEEFRQGNKQKYILTSLSFILSLSNFLRFNV